MNKNKNYILLFLILFFKNQFSSNDFCFKIIENFHKNYNYFRKKIKNNNKYSHSKPKNQKLQH